jgi:RND superfamily putative drug exporter
MPILAFSLTTGLGLDYDIFILTSVVEERMVGWSDTDAVAVGTQRSGPVICWAGIIMAVAYSGFLFSHIPLLNQLGFFIVRF